MKGKNRPAEGDTLVGTMRESDRRRSEVHVMDVGRFPLAICSSARRTEGEALNTSQQRRRLFEMLEGPQPQRVAICEVVSPAS